MNVIYTHSHTNIHENEFTLTHERISNNLMKNFGCLLSIHHSLYHFNYVQGFHSLQIIRLSCVCVRLFVYLDDFFVLLFLFFWQKKKSFGMLAVYRKWVLLDAHVFVVGFFLQLIFFAFIPFF